MPCAAVGTLLFVTRIARELDAVIAASGRPPMIVCNNDTELTSFAIIRWKQGRRIEWHYSAQGKPQGNGYAESFSGQLCENCANGSCRSAVHAQCCGSGVTTSTTCDRIAVAAG